MSNLATVLLALAGSSTQDDLTTYESLPTNIREALKEQLKDEQVAAAKSAANEIVKLFKASEKVVENNVAFIREHRRLIDQAKDTLVQLARAKAYGIATSNFLPLAAALGAVAAGYGNPEVTAKMKVPADWVDPSTVVATEEKTPAKPGRKPSVK